MTLYLKRRQGQTWRDAAIEQGEKFGLGDDVEGEFNRLKALGHEDEHAAFAACHEWDVLDFRNGGEA